jgi:hypothetical protein
MSLTKPQSIKIINELFSAIPTLFHGFGQVDRLLLDMNIASEKHHRRNRSAVGGFSVTAAAKYFTVEQLFRRLTEDHVYTVDDIINVRNENLYAQAYANKFREQLQDWKQLVLQSKFNEVDYVALMA